MQQPNQAMQKIQKLLNDFKILTQAYQMLKKDYENLYSLFLGVLGSVETGIVIIPKEKQIFLAHEYRIFQKQLKDGSLKVKRLGIHDQLEENKNETSDSQRNN